MLLTALSSAGIIPGDNVVAGKNINSIVKTTLIKHKIINENEVVIYLYSWGMFSFAEGGSIVTEDSVISYQEDEAGAIRIERIRFDEIDSIELAQEGSFSHFSMYWIYGNAGAEYDRILVLLPPENGGDKLFIGEVERGMERFSVSSHGLPISRIDHLNCDGGSGGS